MSATPVTVAPLLLDLMDAVSTTHVFDAAIELGLIDHLTSGPTDASELAQACATDLSMTTQLLDTLTTLGIVQQHIGQYPLGVDGLPLITTAAHGWSRLAMWFEVAIR